MRVDVEARAVVDEGDAAARRAIACWVEAVRHGHVVGLVEARLDEATAHRGRCSTEASDAVVPATADDPCEVPDEQLPVRLGRGPDASGGGPSSWRARSRRSTRSTTPPSRSSSSTTGRGCRPSAPSLPGRAQGARRARARRGHLVGAEPRRRARRSGEFVAFTDDDAVVGRGLAPRARQPVRRREPDVDALGGLVLPSELETEPSCGSRSTTAASASRSGARPSSQRARRQDDPLFPYAPGRFGAGCNMAFRRATLDALGGFDATLGTGTPAKGGEDLAIFIRHLVTGRHDRASSPRALVRHSHRRTEEEFLPRCSTTASA